MSASLLFPSLRLELPRRYPDIFDAVDRFIRATEFLVEGDTFSGWKDLKSRLRGEDGFSTEENRTFPLLDGRKCVVHDIDQIWEQIGLGGLQTVGRVLIGADASSLREAPVCVNIFFAGILGHMVCFYQVSSEVVDHGMVRAWLDEMFSGVPRCDMMNFGMCLSFLKDLNEKENFSPYSDLPDFVWEISVDSSDHLFFSSARSSTPTTWKHLLGAR